MIDPVTDGWLREQHEVAQRLIKHAQRQYETFFELRYSRRLWAELPKQQTTISGASGYIWYAFWYFRGRKQFNLGRFWKEILVDRQVILFVCTESPSSVSVSFSTMEDPTIVADAIGRCFDAALSNLGTGFEEDIGKYWQRYEDLDPRVLSKSPWALIDDDMQGVSIFDA